MFQGEISEAMAQTATLQEIEGVLSARGFDMFVQWLYQGKVIIAMPSTTEESISALIEFVRLTDMCQVTGVEAYIAQRVKDIYLRKPKSFFAAPFIRSAGHLPTGHPVRSVVAKMVARGIMSAKADLSFLEKPEIIGSLANDVLREVHLIILKVRSHTSVIFTDPLTGTLSQLDKL